jgi:hypothetical protein
MSSRPVRSNAWDKSQFVSSEIIVLRCGGKPDAGIKNCSEADSNGGAEVEDIISARISGAKTDFWR